MRGHGRAGTHRGSSHPAGAWPQARGPAPGYPRRPSQPRSGRCDGEVNAQWNHEKKTCPRQVPEQARCAIGPPWQGDLAPRRGARAIRVAVGGAVARVRARFPRGPMLASRSPSCTPRPICRWAPHEPKPTVFEPFSSAPTPAPARVAGRQGPTVPVGARQHRHGRRDPRQPDFPNATRGDPHPRSSQGGASSALALARRNEAATHVDHPARRGHDPLKADAVRNHRPVPEVLSQMRRHLRILVDSLTRKIGD